ncbi:MAG: hypothetical protein AAGE83_00790 [Pseudomonadota bacterium]
MMEWMRASAQALESRAVLVRWITAGPVAVVLSALFTSAMPLWFPEGSAGVDHIVFPILLFPATWATIFFYAILETSQARSVIVMGGATVINLVLIAGAFWGAGA